jgi:hypothetical protein
MSSTGERPLGEVLAQAREDFTPEHPTRRPWHQPTLRGYELASTGNVAVVNLKHADQAQLRNLGVPSWEQDWLEPGDWTPTGWGVAPPA